MAERGRHQVDRCRDGQDRAPAPVAGCQAGLRHRMLDSLLCALIRHIRTYVQLGAPDTYLDMLRRCLPDPVRAQPSACPVPQAGRNAPAQGAEEGPQVRRSVPGHRPGLLQTHVVDRLRQHPDGGHADRQTPQRMDAGTQAAACRGPGIVQGGRRAPGPSDALLAGMRSDAGLSVFASGAKGFRGRAGPQVEADCPAPTIPRFSACRRSPFCMPHSMRRRTPTGQGPT